MQKKKYDAERIRELEIIRKLYQKVCEENDRLKKQLSAA